MILRGIIPILIVGSVCCVLIGIAVTVVRVRAFRRQGAVENKLLAILETEKANIRRTEKDAGTASE